MPTITFLEVDPEDTKNIRAQFADATIATRALSGKDLIDVCSESEVLSVFINTKITADDLVKMPKLQLLCTRSVGYDHLPIDACRARGITVCNVPDYGSHVIAEHVFALLLSTIRNVLKGSASVKTGSFDYHGLRGMALKGKTIAILGTGKIGRGVAEIAHGFGMSILAVDRCRSLELEEGLGVQYVPLSRALERADILSLHFPETPATHHVINEESLKTMKQGVIIVNTARGGLIESRSLLQALYDGKVQYALLDVLEHEQNFSENAELIKHPRVIATPHIAFYADDAVQAMYADCFQSIHEWIAGKSPLHTIKPHSVVCDLKPIQTHG